MTQLNITTAIIINRPIECVFDYIQDLSNHQAFSNEFLHNFRFPKENTKGVGATLECNIKFLPFPVPTQISITDLNYPYQLKEEGTQGGKNITMLWNLHSIDNNHTAVNIVMSCEVAPVLSESAIEIVQNQLTCAYYRALNKLKLILEGKIDIANDVIESHQTATIIKLKNKLGIQDE